MSKQWLVVGVIVALLGAGAWGLSRTGEGIEGVAVGAKAPDFSAVDLANAQTISFRKDYEGKVTLVNIWATWCIPCRTEMPAIEALYKDFAAKDFHVLAVSIDEGSADPVIAFAKELGLTFTILHDPTGDIQRIYQTTGVPESFLVDRHGMIVRKIIGEHPWDSPANRRIVEQLLAGEPVPEPRVGATDAELERAPGA